MHKVIKTQLANNNLNNFVILKGRLLTYPTFFTEGDIMYLSHSDSERKKMLMDIGLNAIDDLFKNLNVDELNFKDKLKNFLHNPKSVMQVDIEYSKLIENLKLPKLNFCGAGAYQHWIPPIINEITSRTEFYTAYTPYQAEVSQGTLQAIFEFQSIVCELTGMDVANASMYDGATAATEAVKMIALAERIDKLYIPKTLNPNYTDVITTFFKKTISPKIDIEYLNFDEKGNTIVNNIEEKSIILVQTPNVFGVIEDLEKINLVAREKNSFIVVSANPFLLSVYPNLQQFERIVVVTGEGQPFGIPLSFGGPYLGFFAARKKYMRRMPGRIVGLTKDKDGRDVFVLTLQAREQHIRREKATSNICSNQALCALMFLIYAAYFGKNIQNIAHTAYKNAKYLREKLKELGIKIFPNTDNFFYEFTVEVENNIEFLNKLAKENIAAGVPLNIDEMKFKEGKHVIIATTEILSKEDIDTFLLKVKEVLKNEFTR